MSTTIIMAARRNELEQRLQSLEKQLTVPRRWDDTPLGRRITGALYVLVFGGLVLAGWLAVTVAARTGLF